MSESAQPNRARRWRAITLTAVLIAVLAATAALAATVTQRPTISGSLQSGETLTANGGAWTPSSATAEFTWLRCDVNGANCQGITGACGRDYKVRTADESNRLRVRLTVTESGGQAAIGRLGPDRGDRAGPVSADRRRKRHLHEGHPDRAGQGHVQLGHPDRRRVRAAC